MPTYFDTLLSDYTGVEITSVILHDRKGNTWNNLVTIIELIPEEQEPSPLIGTEATSFCDREPVDASYGVYIARSLQCGVQDAIDMFLKPEKGIVLRQGSILNTTIHLFSGVTLEGEPPSDFPLIINTDRDTRIGSILPKRSSALRVWTKIDRQKSWTATIEEKTLQKILAKAGVLTLRHLGFDLSVKREHAGNLYLCCANPLLRRLDGSLMDRNRDLMLHFRERNNKSILGKRVMLEDHRAGNVCFSIERTITSLKERFELPHFPYDLTIRLYNEIGHLIENRADHWMNILFQSQVKTTDLQLTVKKEGKKEKRTIPKYVSERPISIAPFDHSLAQYFQEMGEARKLEELERAGEFVFFPGRPEDPARAKKAVETLLNKASKRCMILDPYFGTGDLLYAYLIRNTSVTVQIISSAMFLNSKAKYQSGRKIKQAFLLKRSFDKYKKPLPFQRVELKVLLGGKSPLHDRYIIIDNSVYLMGSSFNEFGSRATTLIKVPAPQSVIQQAEDWWGDALKAVSLTDYVKSIKKKP